MPRFPKSLLVLGGLAAGGAAVLRRRRARPAGPAPSAEAPSAPRADPAAPAAAPPPQEAPGGPESPDSPRGPSGGADDELVAQETAAAARDAAAIGGPQLDDVQDRGPAFQPVYESGEGEAEGFELAEQELMENATHGDGRADPEGDAFRPEVESDRATGLGGEADEEQISEVVEDVEEQREDDPGAGPGITHDR
jgi:hypothetical protein